MNSNKLTTSVCMCTYNGEAFIREQLDSILGQTQLPSEIIICDDRSTDRTLSILREYECQNQQITWKIHENAQNLGWRRNFRECICMASGDVVFLCDQDDIWDPHKIEVFVKAFAENDHIGLLYSDYRPLIMKGAQETRLQSHSKNTKQVEKIDLVPSGFYYHVGCTYAFRRDLIKYFILCWNHTCAHDNILWYVALAMESLYHIDYEAIHFRRHGGNASSTGFKKISRSARDATYSEVLQHLEIVRGILQNVPITEDSRMLLGKMENWLIVRRALYEKRSVLDFIRLFRYRTYYSSFLNYAREINAIIYKSRGENGTAK